MAWCGVVCRVLCVVRPDKDEQSSGVVGRVTASTIAAASNEPHVGQMWLNALTCVHQ